MARILDFLNVLKQAAGRPIGWMIAEEFGGLTGRYHCHLLIVGVHHLSRQFWWSESFRRFGRTRIVPFDPHRGAAFYAAKYAAKALGAIHFGGTLAGVDLSRCEVPGAKRSGVDVARSVDLPKQFYRLGMKRWHR